MIKKLNNLGFNALLTTQFLGAFNDNAFKLLITFLAVDRFAHLPGGTLYISLTGAVFILPFLFFSLAAGFLADRLSKQKIIFATKVLEIAIMGLGFFALTQDSYWYLIGVLFLMGTQSAFFSPSKYGIIPELVEDKKISEANGQLLLWTYAAIILGQACGGYLGEVFSGALYKAAYVYIVIAMIGTVSSCFVTKVPAASSSRKLKFNFIGETFANIKKFYANKAIMQSWLGLAYFGLLATLFQLNIVLYARKIMILDPIKTSLLIIVVAVGIGLGGLLAGKFSDEKVELGLIPLGSLGLSIFTIAMFFVHGSFVTVMICLFLLGVSCGFYIVPLNALLQRDSKDNERGEVLATGNVLSCTGALLGTGLLFLFRDTFSLNAAQIFLVVGVGTIFATMYIISILPYSFVRFCVWLLTHTIYKIRTIDRKNVPEEGGVLLVSNHFSLIDGFFILCSLQRPVRFMMAKKFYEIKWLNPIFRLAKVIPIDQRKGGPKHQMQALEKAREALRDGEVVCIFAEGQLSRTGNTLKFKRGFEFIMDGVDCPVVPVHLDQVWGSVFSYERGKYYWKVPKILPYPITVSFGQSLPADVSAYQVRQEVLTLGAGAFKYRFEREDSLAVSFFDEARKHPRKFCIADSSGAKLSFGQTLISSIALSNQLKKHVGEDHRIGIMIPPSVGGVLSNIAVAILGKVSVNLNYTTSPEALQSIVDQCEMTQVITSKKFIEKLNMTLPFKTIFIEDIVQDITTVDKMGAALKALLIPKMLARVLIFGFKKNRSMDDVATIMFTSGSTGEPKGVMLTQANIKSNLEGLYQVFHAKREDILLGVLPLFHSFGFTGSMWFPLVSGLGAVYHVNPLDAKMVGKLTGKYKATLLMATPTFLNTYTRRCTEKQFKSLRLVVVGAEKLKDQVADAFKEKFGIEPMEGYGCTELSPIAAINLPDHVDHKGRQKAHKRGTIGQPLPGIAVKIIDPDTRKDVGVNENGLMMIKGPNVMKGYFNQDEKTQEVIQDGWYETGDIANVDNDGFIQITDRLSRFSKIAGEMVPHIKIEETMHNILQSTEQRCVVSSVPDAKKGERLVVICLNDVDVEYLVSELKKSDLPNLWIPDVDAFHKVDSIPLLGTGKLDLGAIRVLAKEVFGQSK